MLGVYEYNVEIFDDTLTDEQMKTWKMWLGKTFG